MKIFVTSLLVISLVTVGVFGALLMTHEGGAHAREVACLAAKLDNATCPESVVASVAHHISAVKSLTTAVLIVNIFVLLAALLAVFFTSLAIIRILVHPGRLSCILHPPFINTQLPFRLEEIRRWLSLFVNSPSRG